MDKCTAVNESFRLLVKRHKLTAREVAELMGVHRKTVESWLASPGAASYRTMRAIWLAVLHVQLTKRGRAR